VVRDESGAVLLTRAARNLSVAGKWFLPGGGVNFGEDPNDAIVREIEEETGLHATKVSLLGVFSDRATLPNGNDLHTVRIIYHVLSWSGTIRHESEGTSDMAAWFNPAELATATLMPYVRRSLALLEPHA